MTDLTPRRLPWLLMIAAVIIFIDRWTKSWVERHVPMGSGFPVVRGFLHISHWMNDGAAFSMFAQSTSPHVVRWGLIGFSVVASLIVLVLLVRLGEQFTVTTVALAMVLAGALGNLHDRILYGSVVDFIAVRLGNYDFPDFNVADSSIVTGACLLLLDAILTRGGPVDEASDETEAESR